MVREGRGEGWREGGEEGMEGGGEEGMGRGEREGRKGWDPFVIFTFCTGHVCHSLSVQVVITCLLADLR